MQQLKTLEVKTSEISNSEIEINSFDMFSCIERIGSVAKSFFTSILNTFNNFYRTRYPTCYEIEGMFLSFDTEKTYFQMRKRLKRQQSKIKNFLLQQNKIQNILTNREKGLVQNERFLRYYQCQIDSELKEIKKFKNQVCERKEKIQELALKQMKERILLDNKKVDEYPNLDKKFQILKKQYESEIKKFLEKISEKEKNIQYLEVGRIGIEDVKRCNYKAIETLRCQYEQIQKQAQKESAVIERDIINLYDSIKKVLDDLKDKEKLLDFKKSALEKKSFGFFLFRLSKKIDFAKNIFTKWTAIREDCHQFQKTLNQKKWNAPLKRLKVLQLSKKDLKMMESIYTNIQKLSIKGKLCDRYKGDNEIVRSFLTNIDLFKYESRMDFTAIFQLFNLSLIDTFDTFKQRRKILCLQIHTDKRIQHLKDWEDFSCEEMRDLAAFVLSIAERIRLFYTKTISPTSD
jgi:hypothetical protein